MFKASFDTKCFIFSIAIFSHLNPTDEHLLTASYFFVCLLNSFSIFDPQDGQLSGNLYFTDFVFLFFKSTETTFGITSPALSILTISPTLISFFLISSSLCKVAFETITPPMLTGSTLATGVSAPVLPT